MSQASNPKHRLARRNFLKAAAIGMAGLLAACESKPEVTQALLPTAVGSPSAKPAVSIVMIKGGNIATAVEDAIGLLGGIEALTVGKERIMLKPNLVSPDRGATTKPEVIHALVALMQKAGKTVSIGEGSSVANGFNLQGGAVYTFFF